MSTLSRPHGITAALLGLTLLPASAAASAPQSTLHYRGLEHVPLGVATAQVLGEDLVVTNLGSSGADGVRILLTEADTFMMSAPLAQAMPVGATMISEFRGTVGGLQNAPVGRVGFERTPTGFLAVVDLSPLGPQLYDIYVYDVDYSSGDATLVHSNTGLVGNVIELQPPATVGDPILECFYFAKENIWIWLEEPIITFADNDAGVVVSGNRLEIRPSLPVPPTEGPLEVDVLGAGMPQMLIVDEALGKFGSLHRADPDTAMHACSDCLVVSNTGSTIGDDHWGLTISSIGSSGDVGGWSPSPHTTMPQMEILEMDLSGSLMPGAQLEISSTVMTAAGAHVPLGVLVCRKAGGDAWELEAIFDGLNGYDLQLLLAGSVQASLPGQTGTVQVPESPTQFGGGEFWFTDLRPGYSAGFDTPVGISFPNMGTILADELRFVAMDSPTGPGWSFDSFESFRFEADGIQSLTILGESSLLAESYCTATSNSTGQPAEIFANGSSSVAANDLVLLAGPVPNQFGIFFYGANQALIPFGDGFLCVGGEIHRLDVELATDNLLRHELDNTDPPGAQCEIFPGSTWNFEAWYRDPAGGPAGFNLSNGLELSFLP